jgi:hypothetical protein
MTRVITFVLFLILSLTTKVGAQDQWGVNVGLTPSWRTADPARFLFSADRIDLRGSEVRVGFVRGEPLEGDWGMSFVNKAISENSTLDVEVSSCNRGECGTFYRTLPQTRMTGLEFHQFIPYKTWRDRVQLGMVGSVGLGWLRGNVYKRTITEQSDVESYQADAAELVPPSTAVVPLLSMEIAVAGILTDNIKVRASGGFSMPGYHKFSMTFIYLVPQQ